MPVSRLLAIRLVIWDLTGKDPESGSRGQKGPFSPDVTIGKRGQTGLGTLSYAYLFIPVYDDLVSPSFLSRVSRAFSEQLEHCEPLSLYPPVGVAAEPGPSLATKEDAEKFLQSRETLNVYTVKRSTIEKPRHVPRKRITLKEVGEQQVGDSFPYASYFLLVGSAILLGGLAIKRAVS